jgi:hypothetical protein
MFEDLGPQDISAEQAYLAGVRTFEAERAVAEEDSTLTDESETNSFPSRFLGSVQAQQGEVEPPPPEKAVFYSALFGWHPET